ncbi:MAG: biopolymer transporter ExbD [Hyphomicrobiales bacterium]|jgi:biopolymer transport protein TolR|nr:biopolymer transporter ExbD [Hyphomicrobiales bacterium]NBS01895.1 biopolymer transporter ExbD [Hyphomicrobiales bacterium]
MAMAAAGGGGGSGGRRRRGGRKHRPMSDINMTPFIDVMLVLLIIFMVAAPLMVTGVPLDLPQTKASPLNIDKQPLTISLKTDGKIYLMEQAVASEDVVARLAAIAKTGVEERIFVRADKAVPYGRVAELTGMITAAGYKKIALVNEPEQKK